MMTSNVPSLLHHVADNKNFKADVEPTSYLVIKYMIYGTLSIWDQMNEILNCLWKKIVTHMWFQEPISNW